MAKHLEKELERLKKLIYSLSAKVDENLELAVKSFQESDIELAQRVIIDDTLVEAPLMQNGGSRLKHT